MVGPVELESTTSTMSTWRSNQLSYDPMLAQEQKYYIIFCCGLQAENATFYREVYIGSSGR